ncbi:CpmK protein [Photorhabdus temperata subsp. temperata M1021]|nr:CpmK protein [Photorhabdus temperata subsp. temperata M1021]
MFFLIVFYLFFVIQKKMNYLEKKIQKEIDDKILLCLGETEWPVSINENSIWANANMESLVDAGLVKLDFKRGKNKLWNLTNLGKKEFNKNGDFCYGRMMLKDILNITYINKKKRICSF